MIQSGMPVLSIFKECNEHPAINQFLKSVIDFVIPCVTNYLMDKLYTIVLLINCWVVYIYVLDFFFSLVYCISKSEYNLATEYYDVTCQANQYQQESWINSDPYQTIRLLHVLVVCIKMLIKPS